MLAPFCLCNVAETLLLHLQQMWQASRIRDETAQYGLNLHSFIQCVKSAEDGNTFKEWVVKPTLMLITIARAVDLIALLYASQ